MSFSWDFNYPSQRMPVMARQVVATSQPLASQAGLQMLAQGGNAVDAAVAAALVAGVAYLDPGNVASNMTAGAQYGYLLVWVVVVANVMAWLIQYLSAKLGVVTGESLPQAIILRFYMVWARF